MRATTRLLATFGLLLAAMVGCSKFTGGEGAAGPDAKSNVAIIDLDAIAQQLGYDNQMASAIQQRKASLTKQLGVIQTSFQQEIAKKESELGANPTQEQSQQLAQHRRAAAVKLRQEDRNAGMLLRQYKAQLIQQFRNTVKATARQIAAQRGLSIILTKNDSVVFDYDMAVDITDAVVEQMRAEQPGAATGTESPPQRGEAESSAADDGSAGYRQR
jgi:Skp family chaperone for outer membrane proteins